MGHRQELTPDSWLGLPCGKSRTPGLKRVSALRQRHFAEPWTCQILPSWLLASRCISYSLGREPERQVTADSGQLG